MQYAELCLILLRHGLSGNMYFAGQSTHRVVMARVRCINGAGLTDFCCQKGLKQGEITSTLVFSILINELLLESE